MQIEIKNIAAEINRLLLQKQPVLIALDGRCAAGKTTLAAHLQGLLDCNVFHMDDFFLRPEQRTPDRLREPGGNVDYERFLQTILIPLSQNEPFYYTPFDCKLQDLKPSVHVRPKAINIIEGSYSCHPALQSYYDLRVFLTATKEKQLQRIATRNKDMLTAFTEKWIPLEEQYFSAYPIKEKADFFLDTSETDCKKI